MVDPVAPVGCRRRSHRAVLVVERCRPCWWGWRGRPQPAGRSELLSVLLRFRFSSRRFKASWALGRQNQTDLGANILGGLVGAAVVGFMLRVSPQTISRISEPPSDPDVVL